MAWEVGADPSKIVLMTPFFPNGNDKATATGDSARPIFNSTNQICWSSDLWASGAPATNSRKTVDQGVTSFDAIDTMIRYFANKTQFPALKEIVVAGHSAGAQLTQAYSVVGQPLRSPLNLRIVVGAPGTYVWLNSSRPISTAGCPTFNTYKYGLDNFTYKPVTPAIPDAKFATLDVVYSYGSADNDPNFIPRDPGCEVQTQGDSHVSRAQNYWTSLRGIYGEGIRRFHRNLVMPGALHTEYADRYSAWLAYFSPIVPSGYPVNYSNLTTLGCFADSTSSRILAEASTWSDLMTVESCVAFCASQLLPYAGVEFGNECYVSRGALCYSLIRPRLIRF